MNLGIAGRIPGRLLQAVVVLFGLTVVTFGLVHLLPGDPALSILGIKATPEAVEAIRRSLGTDQPLLSQYGEYLGRLLRGDLGRSFISGVGVTTLLVDHLPPTVLLVGYAVLLAVLIGLPLAIMAAVFERRWPDHLIRGVLVVALGVPSFWLGIVFIAYLSLRWGLFPSGGFGEGFLEHVTHLFLPALTLALTFLAVIVRSLRSSLVEVLTSDYVATARRKGITGGRLLSHHVLRAGIAPTITIIGLNASYLLGASVVVENVFAIPGIGQTLVQAIFQRDLLVIQGIALVFGVIVVLLTLTVDLTQSALDPRMA